MKMGKHDEFIMTPISSVIRDAVTGSFGIGIGIETFPVSEYVMQSLFIKMTGFQEQKLKCIAWEIATNNFDYRKVLLEGKDQLGEYSNYQAKNTIYKRLIENIKLCDKNFEVEDSVDKKEILKNSLSEVKMKLKDTNLAQWSQKKFKYFTDTKITAEDQFMLKETLFREPPNSNKKPKEPNRISETACEKEKKSYLAKLKEYNVKMTSYQNENNYNLKTKYEELYLNRNRLAHNVKSYQKNLPSLNILRNENDGSRNYYIWFFILNLIDSVFIELYRVYVSKLEESIL